jgi:PBSX family phage terminase large subunit
MTVCGAYVDEVTVVPEEFFTQLLGRMSVLGAQLFGTTNPDNPAHWLKAKFLDRIAALPDWRRFQFVIEDNPSLSPAYVESIKREYTGLWFRRFILGEWVAAEGAIYSMWDPDRHVIPHDALPDMQRMLAVGVDWGTTNATSAVLLGLGVDGRLYYVDEWRHDPQRTNVHLTTAQQSNALRDWLTTPHLPVGPFRAPEPRVEWVTVDPSAAALKVQLHQDGLRNVADAYNDVAYGIQTVASGLAMGWLLVSDRCAGLITEAPGYSWDPKATEKGEDKPIKVADHSLDAARYALATTESLWRPHIIDDLEREAA